MSSQIHLISAFSLIAMSASMPSYSLLESSLKWLYSTWL